VNHVCKELFSNQYWTEFFFFCKLIGKYRISILTGYRIVGDWIRPDIGYQIQFYANNQCGFAWYQLYFEDLTQFSRYGASERYWYWIMMSIWYHLYSQGKFKWIINWNKNIPIDYDWVCLVIDELLASTLFMNLRSTIFQWLHWPEKKTWKLIAKRI